jgi:predicted RNA-binding protein YlqC (UPF0109 family)
MEEFLNFVLRRLVENPDEVFLAHAEEPGKTSFAVRARRSDVPRIIGKRGQTIHAIRSLLNAGARKHGGGRVLLDIPD